MVLGKADGVVEDGFAMEMVGCRRRRNYDVHSFVSPFNGELEKHLDFSIGHLK